MCVLCVYFLFYLLRRARSLFLLKSIGAFCGVSCWRQTVLWIQSDLTNEPLSKWTCKRRTQQTNTHSLTRYGSAHVQCSWFDSKSAHNTHEPNQFVFFVQIIKISSISPSHLSLISISLVLFSVASTDVYLSLFGRRRLAQCVCVCFSFSSLSSHVSIDKKIFSVGVNCIYYEIYTALFTPHRCLSFAGRMCHVQIHTLLSSTFKKTEYRILFIQCDFNLGRHSFNKSLCEFGRLHRHRHSILRCQRGTVRTVHQRKIRFHMSNAICFHSVRGPPTHGTNTVSLVATCKPLDALLSFWISIWPHICESAARYGNDRPYEVQMYAVKQFISIPNVNADVLGQVNVERTYVCERCLDRCGENEMKSRKIAANYLTCAIRNGWINHGRRAIRPMCLRIWTAYRMCVRATKYTT